MTYDPHDTGPDDSDADLRTTLIEGTFNETNYVDTSADPTANGETRLNGPDLKVFSGGSVRNLTDVGVADLTQSDFDEFVYTVLDDFADNSLTNRDAPGTTASEFAAGEIGQYFRPEWETDSGSPSASSSALQLSAGDTTLQATKHGYPGTLPVFFESDIIFGSDPTSNSAALAFAINDDDITGFNYDDCYSVRINNDGSIDLRKEVGNSETNLITGSTFTLTDSHTVKVERAGKTWELFVDGTSQGTASDDAHKTTPYAGATNQTDASLDIDNWKVV